MNGGKIMEAVGDGLYLVDNDLRTEGQKLLDLDLRVSTVLILCAAWVIVMFFIGLNKYSYEGQGRVRRKAGYDDNFVIKAAAGCFCFVLGFFSLRPLYRALYIGMYTDKNVGLDMAAFSVLMLFWFAVYVIYYTVGRFAAKLRWEKMRKKKDFYTIQETFRRLGL